MDITTWFIIATTVIILLFDLYLYLDKTKKTISQRIIEWSKKYPVIPFVFGFLMGHWFG